MKKIIFLLPPSEGKKSGGDYEKEELSFEFEKPVDISVNASEKDLKCKGERYGEGIELNKCITSPKNQQDCKKGNYLEAINRYSGVMYNAINYEGMSSDGKRFFEENFLILSGMYGVIKPLDIIGNYKLPIETKGLYKFWGDKVTNLLDNLNVKYIVNLLPNSYTKMIDFSFINSNIINVDFLHKKNGNLKKISHGVKKVKGEWVKHICELKIENYRDFGGEIIESGNLVQINILK